MSWGLALLGLFGLVAGAMALSGPGRIDIVDGQARYLVARGLVDHGDPAVRDPDFWFLVLPGRGGERFSVYRFPHSLAGAVAIWAADASGPRSEPRREFYFSLVGAIFGAGLAVIYAVWFRWLGYSPPAAVGWALAGIFCTPNWFYATSTFDDLLGTVCVVGAVVLAWWARHARPAAGTLAGLALGLAFNVKQPLGAFLLPLLALLITTERPWRDRLLGAAWLFGGLALGLAAYLGYEWYKFPPGTTDEHARLLEKYVHAWPGNVWAGVAGLLLSPSAGIFWYCPTLLLGLAGLAYWRRGAPHFVTSFGAACAVIFVFVSTMSFYKGDPAWGPRYLTPIFGVLWLFVPTAARVWPWRLTGLLLAMGMTVQILGLTVDPHRLYVHHRLPSGFYHGREWIYFHPAVSHLVNRPREIREIWRDDGSGTVAYSPARLPTSAPPVNEDMERGPEAVRKYRVLGSFRFWWLSQRWLEPQVRPVALGPTATGLGLLVTAGACALALGLGCTGARSVGGGKGSAVTTQEVPGSPIANRPASTVHMVGISEPATPP